MIVGTFVPEDAKTPEIYPFYRHIRCLWYPNRGSVNKWFPVCIMQWFHTWHTAGKGSFLNMHPEKPWPHNYVENKMCPLWSQFFQAHKLAKWSYNYRSWSGLFWWINHNFLPIVQNFVCHQCSHGISYQLVCFSYEIGWKIDSCIHYIYNSDDYLSYHSFCCSYSRIVDMFFFIF